MKTLEIETKFTITVHLTKSTEGGLWLSINSQSQNAEVQLSEEHTRELVEAMQTWLKERTPRG